MTQTTGKHTYLTRILHCAFALLIIGQLLSIYIVDNKLFTDSIRTGLWFVHK